MSWHPALENLDSLSGLDTSNKPNNIAYYVQSENAWFFLNKETAESDNPPFIVPSDVESSKWVRFTQNTSIEDSEFAPMLEMSRLDNLLTSEGILGIDFLLNNSKLFFNWDGAWFNDTGFYFSASNYFDRFPFKHIDKYNKSFFIADKFTPGYSYSFTITNPTGNSWLKPGEKLNVWVLSKLDFLMFVWVGLAINNRMFQAPLLEQIATSVGSKYIFMEEEFIPNDYLLIPVDAIIIEILKLQTLQHKQVEFGETFELAFDNDSKIVVVETNFQQSGGGSLNFRAYIPCSFSSIGDKTGGVFEVEDPENTFFDFNNTRTLVPFCTIGLFDNRPECWDSINIVNLNHHPWQIPLENRIGTYF